MSSLDNSEQQNGSINATSGAVPPKPAEVSWTDDQWAAIAVHGSDLLVAAAAGSGKTAVLVERIIRRVMDERDPVDVDRLLVATFTKAAAAEMRHRIREALEKELVREPKSTHLRRQLALMGRASITTLHSFCLDVVKRYGQLAGINPGFRIAGETEAELLRQDVLDAMLEEHYASAEPGGLFWQTVDAFSGERTDAGLHGLIQKLYDESRSHPWPEHWLRSMADRFGERPLQWGEAAAFTEVPYDMQQAEAEAAAAIAELMPKAQSVQPAVPDKRTESGAAQTPLAFPPLELWQSSLLGDARLELEGAQSLLRQALERAEAPGGPAPYALTLQDDIAVVERLQEAGRRGWDALAAAFAAVSFGKLKPCKGDGIDKALQEQVKELRNQAKEQVSRLQEELFGRQPEQFGLELAALAPIVHQLVDLVQQFGQQYSKAKEAKSLVDFGDLEHYCLRILCDPASTPDSLLPSHAAQAYREHFVEVLLDEYQDTNRVQEAIVSLISQSSPGNRFMVGDVKQSIYKFRLAEPGLFLKKYNSFSLSGGEPGRRIDLARNFRSRREVVHAVNYVFKQIMHGTVGEIDYDDRAQLVYGAGYAEQNDADLSVELALLDKGGAIGPVESGDAQGTGLQEEAGAGDSELQEEHSELETAQLEARAIAARIRKLLGHGGGKPLQVFDKGSKSFRTPTYRDFVILLRATQAWAPIFIEELKLCGIPAYAELSTGYFSATEVDVILSLLKIIDNPLQDIPLAAVLRSPIVGMTAEELAGVRLAEGGTFYEAVQRYALADSGGDKEFRMRVGGFLDRLGEWRTAARQGALPDLIWRLYRETGYFDFVGGLPGGQQRQANLRALYDRALQYESTSLRGLFRFLRFIERMRDSGADLGTARAIGEQEDVVRIISIHKSKGLEFPVVFVSGMGKLFNRRDINEPFVTHKELGFGPRYVDQELRAGYPTLPALAIQRRMKRELLAEEMRVLYVALTRAREKLILLGTAASADKLLQAWSRQLEHRGQELPEHELAKARCYLDWVGPALMRHPAAAAWRDRIGWNGVLPPAFAEHPSKWTLTIEPASQFRAVITEQRAVPDEELEAALRRLEAVPADPGKGTDPGCELTDTINTALEWAYPFARATQLFSKTTVSEMKRLHERERQAYEEDGAYIFAAGSGVSADASLKGSLAGMSAHRTALARRPRFMEERKLTAAERGTAYHAVMQYIPLDEQPTRESVLALLDRMKVLELLTAAQRDAIAPEPIVEFFASGLGFRLLRSKQVRREVPFTYSLPAEEAYPGGPELKEKESVLIQGVIDCMFEDESGLALLDFKTDAVQGAGPQQLKERYRVQLELYARAVERIWGRPVTGKFVYYFDGALVMEF